MDTRESDLTEPTRWLAALRSAYARSLEDGALCWRHAHAAVESGRAPPSTLASAALLALETMGPDDPTSLGMSACEALRRHGGADHIEPLRALRRGLPGRPGLRDWRRDVDHALAVMTARVAGSCTCGAEAGQGAPPFGSQWHVEAESTDSSGYLVLLTVRCTRCQSCWLVQRDDSYHYPTFTWSRRSTPS